MNILEEIIGRIEKYRQSDGGAFPPDITLSRKDENELCKLTAETIGDTLASKMLTEGVRETFKKIYGIKIKWE